MNRAFLQLLDKQAADVYCSTHKRGYAAASRRLRALERQAIAKCKSSADTRWSRAIIISYLLLSAIDGELDVRRVEAILKRAQEIGFYDGYHAASTLIHVADYYASKGKAEKGVILLRRLLAEFPKKWSRKRRLFRGTVKMIHECLDRIDKTSSLSRKQCSPE